MSENNQRLASSPVAKDVAPARVLGEFKMNHQHFLIVSLAPDSGGSVPHLPSDHYTELERFHLQGTLCAIFKAHQASNTHAVDIATLLTERELQIATLVACGQANKQIAKHLRISEWTVSTHLRRIFIKGHLEK